jgi:hypothetical protein
LRRESDGAQAVPWSVLTALGHLRAFKSLGFDDDGGVAARTSISGRPSRTGVAGITGVALISSRTGVASVSDASRRAGISLVALIALGTCWAWRSSHGRWGGDIAGAQSKGQNQQRGLHWVSHGRFS